MKNIFLIMAASLGSQMINAQFPAEYFVYLTYGDIWIQHPGSKSTRIQPKQYINSPDVIEIRDSHSEIQLVDKEEHFIVLNTKGIYRANELKGKITQKTDGLTTKFLKLVWEAVSHSSSDFDVYKNETVAASWGGGARGKDCNIAKFPPNRSFFSGDTLIFRWQNENPQRTYRFTLSDGGRNTLMELLVRDTQLVLLTRSQSRGDFFWSVDEATHPCSDLQENQFTLLGKEEADSITTALIKTIPRNKDDIQYNLQVSDMLGRKGYIEEAMNYFNKSWNIYQKK